MNDRELALIISGGAYTPFAAYTEIDFKLLEMRKK
jgi:hypothetical protein